MTRKSIRNIMILLIISGFLVSIASANYCNLQSCRNKGEHTMCLFKNPGPSQKCFAGSKRLGGGVSEKLHNNIVDLHNNLRQKVASGNEKRGSPGPQPKAVSMPKLQWDTELATIAQRWADQCEYHHDACRDVARFQVGQNIGYIGTTGNVKDLNPLNIVRAWYNEVQYYNRNSVPKFTSVMGRGGKEIGHYTQFVWAKTTKVGCGYRKYAVGSMNRIYLVCNYGPSGNVLGQPVYQVKRS